jgi:dTDP-4-amino-4,6-dideoxygalactose transaminase
MIIPRRKPYFEKNIFWALYKLLLSSKPRRSREIDLLEKDLKKFLKTPNLVCVSSGRIGLFLILKFANLKNRREIIIPGYTFGTLKIFIKKAGFTPVPVDIDADTFQMDPQKIKNAITKNTVAILATHIFGEPCDIKNIQKIARSKNIFLIEDCAESLGATVGKTPTGSFGGVAISSFDIAKPLQGIRGGIVFGNNKQLISKIRTFLDSNYENKIPYKEIIRALSGYVISQTVFWPVLNYFFSFEKIRNKFVSSYRATDSKVVLSYRLSPFLALITRFNLLNFKKRVAKRKLAYNCYLRHLANTVNFQKIYKNSYGNKYMIVVKTQFDPIKLRRFLSLKGIDISIREEIADDCLSVKKSNTQEVFNKAIGLPVYESLTLEQIKKISRYIKIFNQSL